MRRSSLLASEALPRNAELRERSERIRELIATRSSTLRDAIRELIATRSSTLRDAIRELIATRSSTLRDANDNWSPALLGEGPSPPSAIVNNAVEPPLACLVMEFSYSISLRTLPLLVRAE